MLTLRAPGFEHRAEAFAISRVGRVHERAYGRLDPLGLNIFDLCDMANGS